MLFCSTASYKLSVRTSFVVKANNSFFFNSIIITLWKCRRCSLFFLFFFFFLSICFLLFFFWTEFYFKTTERESPCLRFLCFNFWEEYNLFIIIHRPCIWKNLQYLLFGKNPSGHTSSLPLLLPWKYIIVQQNLLDRTCLKFLFPFKFLNFSC